MAKPKHGRLNDHAGLISVASTSGAHSTPPDPPGRRPRRRLRPLLRASPRSPSPAVLSALAVIATVPPAVAGGPIPLPTPPPSFLCPFIERDGFDPSLTLSAPISPSPAPSPTLSPPSHPVQRAAVADRYVQGSDSLWRKTDAWTLYGSTCCSSPTVGPPGTQSQSTPSQPPPPTSTPTTAQFDTSVLPAGWDYANSFDSSTESTIILALAIVLAGLICVFIIACVIWRRRKKRTRDIERKLAHKLDVDDSQDNAREKDTREKIRIWAKASARWKSNIRQSARRRRKKPVVSSTTNPPTSPTFSDMPPMSVAAAPQQPRRGSLLPQEPDLSALEPIACLDPTNPPTVPHDPSLRFVSPPTYGASSVLKPSRPSSVASSPNLAFPIDGPHAIQRCDQPPFVDDEPLPYTPPSDGHLATDDKAHLAHIQNLASSPTMINAASASTIQSVSVPEWHEVEDDLENLGIDSSDAPASFHNLDLPPSFPPPPSKTDIPSWYLDDNSLRYDEGGDILVPLPISGLLGPSLGASPGAPSMDDIGLAPSAPSLEGEDDLFQDWDGASLYVSESPALADPNSSFVPATEPSTSFTLGSSFPTTQESIAKDGTLPRYHP